MHGLDGPLYSNGLWESWSKIFAGCPSWYNTPFVTFYDTYGPVTLIWTPSHKNESFIIMWMCRLYKTFMSFWMFVKVWFIKRILLLLQINHNVLNVHCWLIKFIRRCAFASLFCAACCRVGEETEWKWKQEAARYLHTVWKRHSGNFLVLRGSYVNYLSSQWIGRIPK